MLLNGRYAVITGAARGLGQAIARRFVAEGATVLICGRHADSLARTCDEILHETGAAPEQLAHMCADVSKAEDVAALFKHAADAYPQIDILVNNAGVLGPLGPVETTDVAAWEHAFAVNFFGAVSCCRAVLPDMKKRGKGKIISLSGGGVTKPLAGLSAYGASKAALVNFTATLAEETKSRGIDVNAIAPGALATQMLEATLQAGPEKVGADYYRQTQAAWDKGGTPLEVPASLCAYLASDESDGISGRLIAAVWDPWKDFCDHRDEIMNSDIYTMRRIIPRDRGLDWGDVE